MPIKYCLWRQGLIRSPECRLPLASISERLARELDHWIEKAAGAWSIFRRKPALGL